MKIIDLLNKIANGEEVPKKIKYKNAIYTIRDDKDDYTSGSAWFTDSYDYLELNDEVEIIEEEKKIEKLEHMNSRDYLENRDEYLSTKDIALDIETLRHWINKIIDKLNSMEE